MDPPIRCMSNGRRSRKITREYFLWILPVTSMLTNAVLCSQPSFNLTYQKKKKIRTVWCLETKRRKCFQEKGTINDVKYCWYSDSSSDSSDSSLVSFLIFICTHSLGDIIQPQAFKYYLPTDDFPGISQSWLPLCTPHVYLISVSIWISNRHLTLNIPKTVLPNVPTKDESYVPLAKLIIPTVAQARNLEVILYSSAFPTSHIQSTGKSCLHNVSELLLLLTTM